LAFESEPLGLAPEGQLKIAEHFSAGYECGSDRAVREGRLALEVRSIQSSLRDSCKGRRKKPSTEVLGYSQVSLRDTLQDTPRSWGRTTRARRFRRQRSALLWGVVTFVVLQLGLTLSRESWLPELRDPAFGAKMKRLAQRWRGAGPDAVTTVMLGSSRTVYGFRGKLLEEAVAKAHERPAVVFNLGIYGAGPVSELLYLKSLLAKGLRPELLLVEVAPMFLDDVTERDEVGRLPADRLTHDELPVVERYRGSSSQGLLADWWRAAVVPVYAHRVVILSELLPVLLPVPLRVECCRDMDDSGWLSLRLGRQYLTPEHRRRTLEGIREQWAPVMCRLATDGQGMRALRELLTLADREGIATAMVLMPEGPVLRSCYPAATWKLVYASLEALGRQFSSPIINARDWVGEEDFKDSHHLLPSGATAFTERLGREVILPTLQTGHGIISGPFASR
jgi:hypothetical protein